MAKGYARLTHPLVRVGGKSGDLRRASWDEALDRTAELFRSVVDRHGPGAFGLFSCSKATNELNFATQKFGRAVIGSNNIDSCNRT
jgi:formate dehydrogenase major subunit